MIMICQIFLLALIMGIVWYLGYHKGKTIIEREIQNMEYPELTPDEEEKLSKYYKFYKIFDQLMTEEDNDDFFTGNISKSAGTCTNKDEKQK